MFIGFLLFAFYQRFMRLRQHQIKNYKEGLAYNIAGADLKSVPKPTAEIFSF